MRTEPTNVTLQALPGRRDYIIDLDGEHRAKKLRVTTMCIGFNHPDELVGVVLRLMAASVGPGRRRQFVGVELTAHPSDTAKRINSFRSLKEMKRLALELVKEFHVRYALIGFHGLRDIHILAINWGYTGLALKSYLPNRSRPKRVLVAVVDRVEKEINEERAAKKKALLRPMVEVRAAKQKERGRLPMGEQLAAHLPPEREPEIADILQAIRACGWYGVVKEKKVSVSFTPERPPKHFELDLFWRGVMKAWRKRQKERPRDNVWQTPTTKESLPPFEELTAQVHSFIESGEIAPSVSKWLEAKDGMLKPSEDLRRFLADEKTPEANELKGTMTRANDALAKRELDRDGPTRHGEW